MRSPSSRHGRASATCRKRRIETRKPRSCAFAGFSLTRVAGRRSGDRLQRNSEGFAPAGMRLWARRSAGAGSTARLPSPEALCEGRMRAEEEA